MTTEQEQGARQYAADPTAAIEAGRMYGTSEIRFPLDLYADRSTVDPLTDPDFARFAAILGSERFLVVLNHVRPQVEQAIRSWTLAVGYAEAMEKHGRGLTEDERVRLTEDLFGLFLEVVGVPTGGTDDYEKYAEATQPLSFEGVAVLEDIIGKLLNRVRDAAGVPE